MYELVYSSSARIDLEMTVIQDILETSKKNNSENEITGCLLYYKGQFIQILEGRKALVLETYSRIKKDKRHFDLHLLYTDWKKERVFDNWNMAFMELSKSQLGYVSESLFEKNLLAFSEFTDKPTYAVKLFWEKVRQIIEVPNS
ncbi:MAG: hypothetical protein ACJA2N_001810 [Salibacteraceae bacterium]|jgi:hypothetical protein